jgi:broad specificity phosphatase PhoE
VDRLSERPIAAIYSSPLLRSIRTAEALAHGRNLDVVLDRDLLEIDHGDWSGKARAEVARQWPDLLNSWHSRPSTARMPGGETLEDVAGRAVSFLARIRAAHSDGDVVVVSHGTVIRLVLAHFLEIELDRIWMLEIENAGVSIVEDYDSPLVMTINDTRHLDGVRSTTEAQVR